MVCYHFFYDLNHFHLLTLHQNTSLFWRFARWIIVGMFLFAAGVSLVIAHPRPIRMRPLFRRLSLLGAAALLVTAVSIVLFPRTWIYFGVLHFLFVATVIGVFFVEKPRIALLVATIVYGGYLLGIFSVHPLYTLVAPMLHLPRYTEDLVIFIPWFGIFLLGIAFASARWHEALETRAASLPSPRWIRFAGRHALTIYLGHQAILFPLVGFIAG